MSYECASSWTDLTLRVDLGQNQGVEYAFARFGKQWAICDHILNKFLTVPFTTTMTPYRRPLQHTDEHILCNQINYILKNHRF